MPVTTVSPLWKQCSHLFRSYPEAINDGGFSRDDGIISVIALTVPGPDKPLSYLLSMHGDGMQADGMFQLARWPRDKEVVIITADTGSVPPEHARALDHGVPAPRDGSAYGSVTRGRLAGLLLCYAVPGQDPQPSPSFMAAAGTTEQDWPGYRSEETFGSWFWEAVKSGQLVSLREALGRTRGTVFYSSAAVTPGYGAHIAVKAALTPSGQEWMLPAGVYAWWKGIRDSKPVPSLDEVLADPDKTDLGPRFAPGGEA